MIVDSEVYEGEVQQKQGVTERGETEATLDIYQKHADDYMVKEVPSGAKEQALSSYTVAYDRQSSENTTINICGNAGVITGRNYCNAQQYHRSRGTCKTL